MVLAGYQNRLPRGQLQVVKATSRLFLHFHTRDSWAPTFSPPSAQTACAEPEMLTLVHTPISYSSSSSTGSVSAAVRLFQIWPSLCEGLLHPSPAARRRHLLPSLSSHLDPCLPSLKIEAPSSSHRPWCQRSWLMSVNHPTRWFQAFIWYFPILTLNELVLHTVSAN